MGATRYDIYRDGTLYRRWSQISSAVTTSGNTMTWTDSTGYGHAHLYTVVPSNRWELGATFSGGASAAAAQTTEVGVGTQLTAALGAPGKQNRRLYATPVGAYTAPATPTLNQPANRLPANQNNLNSTRNPNVAVSWTAAPWTGAYASTAQAATHFQLTRSSTTVRSWATAVSVNDTSVPRGVSSTWTLRARVDAARMSPTTTRSLLTWPAAPSCTTAAASSRATHRMIVTANRPSGQNVTSTRVTLTARGAAPAATSTGANRQNPTSTAGGNATVTGDRAVYERLYHGTNHSFRAQARNAAGWGPAGNACSRNTARISASLSLTQESARPTRSLVARINATNATSTNTVLTPGNSGAGSSASILNERVWPSLPHGTSHRLTGTASDGFNTVTASPVTRSTLDLKTPTINFPQVTTRSITARSTVSTWRAGTTLHIASGGETAARSTSGAVTITRDYLNDGTTYTTRAWVTDGYNIAEHRDGVGVGQSTLRLTPPTCSVSSNDRTSPGAVTIAASGGNSTRQIRLGSTGTAYTANSRIYTGLNAGTWVGYARSTDGHNNTPWRSYGGITIVSPPPPTPTLPASSPLCEPYLAAGRVTDALSRYTSGYGPVWRPRSGSFAANGGVHLSGAAGTTQLQCTFFRLDEFYEVFDNMWTPRLTSAIVYPLGGNSSGV